MNQCIRTGAGVRMKTRLMIFAAILANVYFLPIASGATTIDILNKNQEILEVLKSYKAETSVSGSDVARESDLVGMCETPMILPQAVVGLVLDYAVTRLVALFFDSVEAKTKEALDKFSAQYSSHRAIPAAGEGTICFEFRADSKGSNCGTGDSTRCPSGTGMKFLGQLKFEGDTIKIRPLRLEYKQARAQNYDSKEPFVTQISATGRGILNGKKTEHFDQTLIKAKLDGVQKDGKMEALPTIYFLCQPKKENQYCNDGTNNRQIHDWETAPVHPYSGKGQTIEVIVAETGAKPKLLKTIYGLLQDNKVKLSKNLTEVILEKIKLADD